MLAVLVEFLGFDRELVEDLELALNRCPHLVEAAMVSAEEAVFRFDPLEFVGEQTEAGPVEEQRPLRIALEEGAQLLGGVLVGFVTLRGIAHRRYLGDPLVDLPVGQREEELLLACEVRVERADGVAGLGGNLVNRGAVVAATGKDRQFEMRVADATSLPFPDESFDTVVCTYGLCTIPDDAAAVREAMRVLRPGGRILSPSMSAVRTPSCGPSSGLPDRSPIALAATTCCASHSITSGQRASRSTS